MATPGSLPGTPSLVDYFEVTNRAGGAGAFIVALYSGVTRLLDEDKPASTTLELTTEKDIKLFQADDVVQGTYLPARTYSDSWVDGRYSNTSAQGIVEFFDGNLRLGQTYKLTTNSTRALEFDPPIVFSGGTVGVSAYQTTTGSNFGITIDGTEYLFAVPTSSNASLHTFSIPAGNIEAMGMSATNIGWNAVQLNGNTLTNNIEQGGAVKVTSTDVSSKTIIVDGGSWDTSNQSQVWSTNVTDAQGGSGYEYDHVFDGDSTTYYTRNGTGTSVQTFTGFESITSLSILGTRYSAGGNGGGDIIVNQGLADEVNITSQIPVGNNPATGAAVETSITGVSSLKTLSINSVSGGNGSFLAGIKVDGNSWLTHTTS